jgi:hypothetical protein
MGPSNDQPQSRLLLLENKLTGELMKRSGLALAAAAVCTER